MSKRFKGKVCAYCGGESETGDHVVGRNFVLDRYRANLPQVPACGKCNVAKSALETYAMAVMAFGGRHADAVEQLTTKVPERLAKNNKLSRALQQGYGGIWVSGGVGAFDWRMAIPLNGTKLDELMRMIAQGLANFHFNVVAAPGEYMSYAGYVTGEGAALLDRAMSSSGQKVADNLGNGAFVYEGLQSRQTPGFTVWRMKLYDAQVAGPGGTSSLVYGFTAPRGNAAGEAMLAMLRGD